MSEHLKCVSPIDGSVYIERPLAGADAINAAVIAAHEAQAAWRATPIETRQNLLDRAVDAFVAKTPEIAEEITRQMGRPLSQSPARSPASRNARAHMIQIAPEALADVAVEPKEGFTRFIRRDPLGCIFVIAPWNYPYLTAVNAIVPALMAGNAVLLKHSAQTPLCAERFSEAFAAAGLPEGLFQHLHLSHDAALGLIGHPGVDFVSFTGSVPGGSAVQKAAAGHFIATGLELGGKDPAYVRADAKLEHAVETLVDGAFFNSGQSCCGIERIYIHEKLYDDFVEGAVALAGGYKLGNPLENGINLGPMVRASAAEFVRGQIAEATAAGATALLDPAQFPADTPGSAYMAPQILTGVDHSMRVMSEESFGPVVGIMKVASDEEAITLMNDSAFGLTAAIWTEDLEAAIRLGDAVETGTWFMNRCDYLDPALAWSGVKDSGRGCSLSRIGYEQLTRPKSFHLKTVI